MRQVLDFILDADVYSQWQVTLNINVFILQLFIPPITLLETFLILLSCDWSLVALDFYTTQARYLFLPKIMCDCDFCSYNCYEVVLS